MKTFSLGAKNTQEGLVSDFKGKILNENNYNEVFYNKDSFQITIESLGEDIVLAAVIKNVYTDKDRQPFKVNEGMRRFKVYVSGESEPLVLMGRNEKEVKQLAHQMIQNSSVKIKKVVKENAENVQTELKYHSQDLKDQKNLQAS